MTESNVTTISLVIIIALFVGVIAANAQVQTNCTIYGNTANCTSTDTGAAIAERNRENAAAGEAMGKAIGTGIRAAVQHHREKKAEKEARRRYCDGTTPAWCAAYGK